MLAEATMRGLTPGGNPAPKLANRPEAIRALTLYKAKVRALVDLGFGFEACRLDDLIDRGFRLQEEHGLLANDAVVLTVALRLNADALASGDKAFRGIATPQVYFPTNLRIYNPTQCPAREQKPDVEAMPSNLVDECLRQSLRLLRENTSPHGILAAAPTPRAHSRHYDRVFGRDAAICAIAASLTADPALERAAWQSLLTLAEHQAENGQIPKFVDPQASGADFWYLGCIDATLWWLIALRFLTQSAPALEGKLRKHTRRALAWLACQEHQQIFLLQQNEASDWADIMPRSGFVLYTNALWYHVKRLYGLPRAEETRHHFNWLFHPFASHLPEYRRLRLLMHYVRNRAQNRELYLSFVNLGSWGEEGDVFGNLLAILFGLASGSRASRILHAIGLAQAGAAHPVRVTCTPIRQTDPLWRPYMGRHRQNLEHQYHNGGVWPMVGGFWVMALAAAGKPRLAREELVRLAAANAVNEWEFNEWFHGASGKPCGMPRQSWNAATFLLAHRALERTVW